MADPLRYVFAGNKREGKKISEKEEIKHEQRREVYFGRDPFGAICIAGGCGFVVHVQALPVEEKEMNAFETFLLNFAKDVVKVAPEVATVAFHSKNGLIIFNASDDLVGAALSQIPAITAPASPTA